MARNHKVDADAVLARVQSEGPDWRVSRSEAAALLDLLLAGRSSYERRKHFRNQLVIAGQPAGLRSRLPKIENASTGITIDDLAHWAAELYGQTLSSLPQRPRIRQMTLKMTDGAVASGRADLLPLPGTLEKCHAEIERMYAEIRSLKKELAAKDRQLAGKEQEFKDRQTARFRKK
jgi:hypothetical protein